MNDQYPSLCDGRYIVTHCIGNGGMGAVFRCYDQRLKVDRAVKILRPELVSRADKRQRFTREAIAMAQLNHPNVVQIFDYGQEALTLFIIMEYLPLDSLQEYLDKVGVLNRGQTAQVCLEVAKGLQFMHQKEIIHRDVKPANILIASTGVKVGDFGLVRSDVDHFQTHSQAIMGTFAFMSPEQRLGAKDVTHQTDIYALAASMYVMLTNGSPLHLHHNDERDRLLASVDPALAHIMDKGLQPDLSKRYTSIDEMITDLEHVLETITEDSKFYISDIEVKTEPQDLSQLMEAWHRFTSLDTVNSEGAQAHGSPSPNQAHPVPDSSYLLSEQIEGVDVDILLAPTYVPHISHTYPPLHRRSTPIESSEPQVPPTDPPSDLSHKVPPTDPPSHTSPLVSPHHKSQRSVLEVPPTDPPIELSVSPESEGSSLNRREGQDVESHRDDVAHVDSKTTAVSKGSAQSTESIESSSGAQVAAGLSWGRVALILLVIAVGTYVSINLASKRSPKVSPPVSKKLEATQPKAVAAHSQSNLGQSQAKSTRSPLEMIDTLSPQELIYEAERALLSSTYPLADHFLHTLKRQKSYESQAHLLLSLTSFMRGRIHLSSVYSHLSVQSNQEDDSKTKDMSSLMEESRRQSDSLESLSQRWRSLLDQDATPMMSLAYLISTRDLWPDLNRVQLKNEQQRYPDAVVFKHLSLILMKHQNPEMYDKVMKSMCTHDQDVPILLFECAKITESNHEVKLAQALFKKVLKLDDTLTEASAGLAMSYEESGEKHQSVSVLIMNTSDTIWPNETLRFLHLYGVEMSHHGGLRESSKLLRFCKDQAMKSKEVYVAAHCVRDWMHASLWLNNDEQLDQAKETLKELIEVDGFDPEIRLFNMLSYLGAEADKVARDKDWTRFNEIELQVNQAHQSEDVLKVKDKLLQRLKSLRLLYQAKTKALREAVKTRRAQNSKARSCLSVYEDALMLSKLGDAPQQIIALKEVIEHRCIQGEMTSYVQSNAEVTLAEVLLSQKQRREAQTVIQSFLKYWTLADKDLSISQRAQAAFKKL